MTPRTARRHVPRTLVAARVRVPASSSNLGAGFDCLGLAITRYLTVAFTPGEQAAGLRVDRRGTLRVLDDRPDDRDILFRAFGRTLESLGSDAAAGTIVADSEIPIGRGLGSSAAAVVGGIVLAMTALGESPDADRVFKIAGEFEHHLDNVAPALLGGLVGVAYRDDGVPHAFPLPLSERVGFAFAAPGVEIETQRARDALPARVTLADAVHNIGAVVALTQALATGDPALVRLGLSDRLHVRYRVPLIPAADLAIAAAVERGAWGATVSGAGSGIIAFSEPARAAAVADAMAAVFRAEVGVHGVVAFAADAETRGTVAG